MANFGEPLSERELDVLRCLAGGASNREIAADLSISHNTVKVHLRNVYAKLGVASRTEAATVAIQKGWVLLAGVETAVSRPRSPDKTLEPETSLETAPPISEPLPAFEQSESQGQIQANPRPTWLIATILLLVVIALSVLGWQAFAGQPVLPTVTPEPFVEQEIGSQWAVSRPLLQGRKGMAIAAVGLQIYAIAGETVAGVVNEVNVFHSKDLVWSTATSKPTAVSDVTAAVLFGEIYVPGGRLADGQPTAIVEAYSPTNNAWRPIASLPQPVAGGLTLTDGNFLYLFGGWNGREALDTAYAYDANLDRWRPLPGLPRARAYAAGGEAVGRLYVVGGMADDTPLADCQSFDPVDETWQDCPDMLQPRASASGTAVLNKLYIIGGEGVTGDEPFSELFDPSTRTWQVVNTPMLDSANPFWSGLGITHIETRIYALGGEQEGELSAATFIYKPLVYQTFLPAAASRE